MVNSIRKGKSFERECVKFLSSIFTDYDFHRIPQSGAFSTNNKTKTWAGDILGEHKEHKLGFPYVIECKIISRKVLLEDLTREKSILYQWIKQTKNEAQGKAWMLLFRHNGGRILLLTNASRVVSENTAYRHPYDELLKKCKFYVIEDGTLFWK